MIVDLRSDTLTQPTPAMREAMASAAVGDDVWREDPMAHRLEERTAELLGKEAALFVPSGTMANQIALLLHCRPGDEVICGRGSHVRLYESGAGAAWAGVQFAEIGEADGTFDSDALLAAMQPDADHAPRTRLVSFENTHNRGGGRIWPADRMRKACEEASAPGRRNRQEVKVQTRGPGRREPDTEETRASTRSTGEEELGSETSGRVWGPDPQRRLSTIYTRPPRSEENDPREGMSGGVVGARPHRTKVKRRKAVVLGKPACRGEARYAPEART